jgi:hypothetical protein
VCTIAKNTTPSTQINFFGNNAIILETKINNRVTNVITSRKIFKDGVNFLPTL